MIEKKLRRKKKKCTIEGDQKDYFGEVRLSFSSENQSLFKKWHRRELVLV